MEGLFDNLEGRSDSKNFEPLTSTLRFSPFRFDTTIPKDHFHNLRKATKSSEGLCGRLGEST